MEVEIASEIITSYVLKNVVFWICEGLPQKNFSNDHLLELLKTSLEYIIRRIEENSLPNYFIPERNLLEGRLLKENRHGLLNLLSGFVSDGPSLVVKRITALQTSLKIMKYDIASVLAITLFKNSCEIRMVNERLNNHKTFGGLAVAFGFKQFIDFLIKKGKQ